MTYTVIPMESYPRKAHLAYYRTFDNPFFGVTAPIDVTDLYRYVKRERLPLFLSLLYVIGGAANDVSQLRQRLCGDELREYARCRTSHTEALDDGTYCYCTLDADMPYKPFLEYARAQQAHAKANPSLADDADATDMFFVSSMPWLEYTALMPPIPRPADTNVRLYWGGCRDDGERVTLPVSIYANHALADGRHIAQFYERLRARLRDGLT